MGCYLVYTQTNKHNQKGGTNQVSIHLLVKGSHVTIFSDFAHHIGLPFL